MAPTSAPQTLAPSMDVCAASLWLCLRNHGRERDKKEDTEEAGIAVPSTSAAAAACTVRRVNYGLWVWTAVPIHRGCLVPRIKI